MKRSTHGILFVSLLLSQSLSTANAQVFNFQEGVSPTASYLMGATEIRLDQPNTNRDLGSGISVGVQGFNNSIERGLFSFNLAALPDSATISSISFTLTITSPDGGSGAVPIPLELRLLTSTFDETTVTWNTQPAYSTLLSSVSILPNSVTNGQPITWSSTPAFLAATQAASNANGTLDFVLRIGDTFEADQTTRNVFSFNSDDTTLSTSRPLLSVTTVPEPSTLIALGSTALGFGMVQLKWRRKRRKKMAGQDIKPK